MRISDWSSDVCSSDLRAREPVHQQEGATSLAGLEDHELGGPVGGGVAGDGDGAGGGQPRAPIPKPPMTSARGGVSSSAGPAMSMSAPSSNNSTVLDRKRGMWGQSVSDSGEPGGRRRSKQKKALK